MSSIEWREAAPLTTLFLSRLIISLGAAFAFLIPFYDVPQIVRPGVAVSGILAVALVILIGLRRFSVVQSHAYVPVGLFAPFTAFFALYLIAALVNVDSLNPRAVNHLVFYVYTFIVYAVTPFLLMREYGTNWFCRYLVRGTVLAAAIGFYEFSVYYTQGFEAYRDFLSHGANVGIFSGLPRIRSTFNEPSHFALYLIPVAPLLFRAGRPIALFLIALAFIGTFSVSAFAGVLVAIAVLLPLGLARVLAGLRVPYRRARLFAVIALFALLVVAIAGPGLWEPFFEKLTQVKSVDPTRWAAWLSTLQVVGQNPMLGVGPAGYYEFAPTGVFSWYLQIAVEAGLIAVFFLISIFMVTLVVGIRARVPLVAFAVLGTAGQMATMNHYYIPGLWLLIAFVFARDIEQRDT